jgi:hypothetical protein
MTMLLESQFPTRSRTNGTVRDRSGRCSVPKGKPAVVNVAEVAEIRILAVSLVA